MTNKDKTTQKVNVDIVVSGQTPLLPTAEASEEQKREAYYYFGVLSASFAELESRVQFLLGTMCHFQGIIEYYLIEENSLDRNMQLLNKINQALRFAPEKIKKLSDEVRLVRQVRNDMIHGRWEIFLNEGLTPVIAVWESKIKAYKSSNGHGFQRGYQHVFTFAD